MAKKWFKKKSMAIKDAPEQVPPRRRRPSAAWFLSLVLGVLLVLVLTHRWGDDETVSEQARSSKVANAPDARIEPPAKNTPPETPEPSTRQQAKDDTTDAGADHEAADKAEKKQTSTAALGLDLEGPMAFANLSDMAVSIPDETKETEEVDKPHKPGAAAGPSKVVTQWCKAMADRVGAIVLDRCMDDGFVDTGSRSVQDRPLVVREVDASDQPASGRVLLISATHGDEPSSIGTAFAWIRLMADDGTPYNWHVMPALNPDGVLDSPATRVNANGVDLNRNLPTDGWERESRDYWRRVGFEKRRFPGKAPGSEPENQWLVKEIRTFDPDVIITLHAPYGVLDYDGKFPAPRKLGDLRLHRLGVYPGSLGNFASRMQGIPVITVELEDAHEPPSKSEIKDMWVDLNGWLDRYMRSVRQARSENGGDAG